jgi:hypothetical protein
MKVFKKCRICKIYFESELGSFNSYCQEHQDHFPSRVNIWLQQRYVPIEFSDCWIFVEKDNQYVRICRRCGKILVNKSGSYSKIRRYCSTECSYEFDYKWNASLIRNRYLIKLHNKQIKDLEKLECWELKSNDFYRRYWIFCEGEGCNKLGSIGDNDYISYKINGKKHTKRLPQLKGHHIIEVHTLDLSNWKLCFDEENFIGLCSVCHGIRHRKKEEIKIPEKRKYTDITTYIL